MIENLFNSSSMPVLERMIQFTSSRHKVIVDNIANKDTPNYKSRDVNPKAFQAQLRKAIDERRSRTGGPTGTMQFNGSRQVTFNQNSVELNPKIQNDNILFHDRNNSSIEDLMKNLATNTGAHNTAMTLMRNQFDMLEIAIRERI